MSKWQQKCEQLPTNALQCKYRRHVIHVDSKDRLDPDLTTQSQYTVLISQINSVKELKLASSEILGSSYIVNSSNNTFAMTQGVNNYTITLTNGNYNGTTFAAQVQSQTQTVTGQLVTVTYSSTTDKLTITAPVLMTISFDPSVVQNSANVLMGFNPTTYNLPAATPVVGPNLINLAGDTYVLMLIKGYGSISAREISGDIFAKIVFNQDQTGFSHPFVANTFVFVLPRMIERLYIEFRRPNGSLYDFGGKDHSFSIEALSDF